MYTTDMTPEKALEVTKTGLDCSQVVFAEFAPQFGIDKATAEKIAANFGGGLFEGATCGAVTGALMALGLKYGHFGPVDLMQKNRLMQKGAEFKKRFTEKHGSCVCQELIDYKIPEEITAIMEEDKFGTVCCYLIFDACHIVADMLNEEK